MWQFVLVEENCHEGYEISVRGLTLGRCRCVHISLVHMRIVPPDIPLRPKSRIRGGVALSGTVGPVVVAAAA